jgi:hypothetical protein
MLDQKKISILCSLAYVLPHSDYSCDTRYNTRTSIVSERARTHTHAHTHTHARTHALHYNGPTDGRTDGRSCAAQSVQVCESKLFDYS